VILIPVPVADSPSWADTTTAVGTVALAVATVAVAAVAVWVALWTDRRAARRILEEHERSDRLLKEERERSDRLLEEERRHSTDQIEEERRIAQEREQLAEAYQVQVVLGENSVGGEPNQFGDLDGSVRRLAVMVVNRGSFTITRVEAQFCYDGVKLGFPQRSKRLTGFGQVRERLREGWSPSAEHALDGVLTPRDAGVRFESYQIPAGELGNPYPLVRWTDRWGTRWEHRRGEVRQVRDDEAWTPLRGGRRLSGSPAPAAPAALRPRLFGEKPHERPNIHRFSIDESCQLDPQLLVNKSPAPLQKEGGLESSLHFRRHIRA